MRGFMGVVALLFALQAQAAAATFTVNSTLDTDDKSADGLCRDVNNKCTLRAAITEANRDPSADVIQFAITGSGTKTITPLPAPGEFYALPLSITSPVTLDGTTQNGYAPGAPVIEIDGLSGMGYNGFIVSAAGCEIRGLRIKEFRGAAVTIAGAGACVIRSNHFVNDQYAIDVEASGAPMGSTVIGGLLGGDRNVFSSVVTAIFVNNGPSGVKILGNYFGTDVTGTVAARESTQSHVDTRGIRIFLASAEIRNNVVANSTYGIDVVAALPTIVAGNLIGTAATGTTDFTLRNGWGIRASGPTEILGNTIAGNATGISVRGPGVTIRGNQIGMNMTGAESGNATGIEIETGATDSTIGGPQGSDANVISGNTYGITIYNFDATTPTRDHLIVGNYMGVLGDGITARPNLTAVWIENAAHNRVENNIIANNSAAAIVVKGPLATDNTIRGNSIFDNVGLAIDLENDYVTQNDFWDSDNGANDRQNFPLIATGSEGANTYVGGTLESTPGASFQIDFYASPTCSNRNAKQYLSTTTVFTDGNGRASMLVPFDRIADGTVITATATSASGDTSELSACAVTAACTAVALETPLPVGSVGAEYFFRLEPTFPYQLHEIEITGGALPPGLSLLSTGELEGIPEASGTFSFTVRVIDTRGCVSFQTLQLDVCASIVITPSAIGPLPRQMPFELQLVASGGTPPYGFYVIDGPNPLPGMTLSSSGVLQGTPYLDGTYNFYVTAYDQNACTGTQGYTIGVGCFPLDISPNDLPVADLGASYRVQLTGNGGFPPYQFEVGLLPPGLEMSREGLIAGTPRERGSTTITVTITDGLGCRQQVSFQLVVDVSNPPGCDCSSNGRPSSLLLPGFVLVMLRRRRNHRRR